MPDQLLIKNKIEIEKSIKIAPFKKHIRKTHPHKHNSYFEIVYLTKGSGYHVIDTRQFEICPPVLYFIRKEQVHYWELDAEPEGFVVIVKKAFLTNSLDQELKSLFSKISLYNSLTIQDNSMLSTIFELLTEENERTEQNNSPVIEGLLKVLLAKIMEKAVPVMNSKVVRPDLYHSFVDLLSVEQAKKHGIQHYALKLNTTPQNLNTICRKSVNLSASKVLEEFIINEAKRLLLYTNNNISEVAFNLDFVDVSHFVKYFKRATGQTPLAFRVSSE